MLKRGHVNDEKLITDVREQMFIRGMQINDLAEEIGYSAGSLYRYFSGIRSTPIAQTLITHFGLNEEDYLKGDTKNGK